MNALRLRDRDDEMVQVVGEPLMVIALGHDLHVLAVVGHPQGRVFDKAVNQGDVVVPAGAPDYQPPLGFETVPGRCLRLHDRAHGITPSTAPALPSRSFAAYPRPG